MLNACQVVLWQQLAAIDLLFQCFVGLRLPAPSSEGNRHVARQLKIRLFGTFEAIVDGEAATRFEAATARGLLAYLSMRPQQPMVREMLARLLWGLDAGPTGLTNLRSAIRRLRSALGDEESSQPILWVGREALEIDPTVELLVDASQFEALVTAVHTHAHLSLDECAECKQRLHEAVDLYRGQFLDELRIPSELFQEWQRAQQERLNRMAVQALYTLADLELRCGSLAVAEQLARRQLALENWNEEAHRQLMRILYTGGQRSAALAQYERCTAVLADELGIEPSPETRALYVHLVAGGMPVPQPSAANPYKGLSSFGVADAGNFFGRRTATRALLEATMRHSLVMLLGPSGSGKTSVVNAGLIATLLASQTLDGQLPTVTAQHTPVHWSIVSFRPGSDPLGALVEALGAWRPKASLGPSDSPAPGNLLRTIEQALAQLASAVTSSAPGESAATRLLVIVDQFEELFTLCRNSAARDAFLDFLLKPARTTTGTGDYGVLLVLRADFLAQALQSPGMADALQNHLVVLGPMTRDDLQRSIEEPARLQGVGFEPGLVERLLDDVGDEPGKLPLLQFALARLWQAKSVEGWITHNAYDDIEGVRGALTHYADGVYARLQPHAQQQAQHVLLSMVQPGQDAPDTRRIAARGEIGETAWPLIQHFADERLVVTDCGAGGETAELAHEALIREWHRLRGWLENDRAFQTWQQGMRVAFEQWHASGQEESGLLHGSRLAEAERWSSERSDELPATLRRYVEASIALRQRLQADEIKQRQRELAQAQALAEAEHRRAEVEAHARQRLRRLAIALAATAVVAFGLAVFAFQAQRSAEASARLALARQLGAQVANEADAQLDLALLLSQEALRLGEDSNEEADLVSKIDVAPWLDRFLHGHPWPIYGVTFGVEGEQLLATNEQGAVVAWDLNTDALREVVDSGRGVPESATVSPRGDRFATAGTTTITLWDSSTRQPVGELKGHSGVVTNLSFTPDGSRLVSGDAAGNLMLWDATAATPLAALLTGNQRTLYGPVTNDGRILLLGDDPEDATDEDTYVLWDTSANAPRGAPLAQHTDNLHGYSVSPDETLLATASFDGTVRLWDLETGAAVGEPLRGHEGRVLFVAFSPDGKLLASGGTDNQVWLWNVPDGTPFWGPMAGHTNWVRAGRFSADGGTLATGDASGDVLLWKLNRRKILRGHTDRVRSVALSPDASTLVTGGFDKRLIVWDAADLRTERVLGTGHANAIIEIAFSPDGRTLASADAGGGMIFWDTATWEPRFPLYVDRSSVLIGLDFSPDGKTLVAGAFDGAFQPWDVATGRPARTPVPAHSGWALSVRYSPDGRRLATGGVDGKIQIWETATWQPVGEAFEAHENWVTELLFAPDGNQLVSSSADSTIRFWDVGTGAALRAPLRYHKAQVWDLHLDQAHMPARLISLGGDGTLMWWEWATGLALSPPLRTQAETERMAVSPDGTRIYLGSFDDIAQVVAIDDAPWPERACHIANRNLTAEEWREYLHELPYRPTCLPSSAPMP